MCYGPLEPFVVPNQYFTETVYSLRDDEVLVDCGAYDGDTVREFHHALKKQIGHVLFEQIYAFEPNHKPFFALVKNTENQESITCIQRGVWNEPAELRFSGDKARSSKIDNDGDVVINVDPMDTMLGIQRVSIIKLDLEGAELQALQGAKKLIRRNVPVIAVCVYHKNDDLFTIPGFIDSLALPYHYYLRAHESKSGELVLYCIPENRRIDRD
jgi:FkbM family methyltransferase